MLASKCDSTPAPTPAVQFKPRLVSGWTKSKSCSSPRTRVGQLHSISRANFREIDEEVGRGAFRDALELILVPGTRPVDLLRKLNENQPQVVHLSSHGSPDEIILESAEDEAEASGPHGQSARSADERDMKNISPAEVKGDGCGQGRPQLVSKSALVNVLRSCNEGNLRLVVLNACNTRPQAEALTEVVDCVISMNRTVTDRAAIKFAASFYGALAFGRSVQKAFDQGVGRG